MGLLSALIPNGSADVVAVFDQTFTQLFPLAHAMKLNVTEDSAVMKHPLETGSLVTDHAIFNPDNIELLVMVTGRNYRSVFQQIKSVYRSRAILTIQTKGDTYTNMIISGIPRDEDPEQFDALNIGIRLEEVRFVSPQYGTLPPSKVSNKTQASTVKKGEQQTKESTPDQAQRGGVLYRLWHNE